MPHRSIHSDSEAAEGVTAEQSTRWIKQVYCIDNKSFGADSSAGSFNSAISSDWPQIFIQGTNADFRVSKGTALMRMRVRVNHVGIPAKLSRA